MVEVVMDSAGGGSEWQEEYYVISRHERYVMTSVPHHRRAKPLKMAPTSRLKPYTLGCYTLVELQLECFTYLCGILSVFGTRQIYIFHIHICSLQSSMWSKCSAHRFAKLSIRGTVGFYVFSGKCCPFFLYSIYLWMYT